jgi:micrococcal nuclease
MYEYQAHVLRIVDGDTVHLRLDLGCDIRIDLTGRLARIDTPEMNTDEGKAAKEALRALLDQYCPAWVCVVRTEKDRREKYGRYLVNLYAAKKVGTSDELFCLNDYLVSAGHAVYKKY